jgi:hypothetical protein
MRFSEEIGGGFAQLVRHGVYAKMWSLGQNNFN